MKLKSLLPRMFSSLGLSSGLILFSHLAWNSPSQAQTQVLPTKPVWEHAPTEQLDTAIQWTAVERFADLPSEFRPIPSKVKPQELAAKPRVEGPYRSPGIYGIGGGVRTGTNTGDTTAGLVTGRIGYKFTNDIAISIRPTGIFGPDNNNSNNNNDYNGFEFRLPFTVDLFPQSFISPFFGGGLATNVDNLGYTDGMLTGGLDINITNWLTIGVNVNYIYQTNIDDTDWETLGMVYLRF